MDAATARLLHKTMKKVTGDVEALAFNTAISALMVLANHLSSLKDGVPRGAVEQLVLMVSPLAPHLGEECWSLLGHQGSIATAPWVAWDDALCQDASAEIGVQVNGKKRGAIELPKDATQADATAAALALPGISKFVDGKPLKKVVYVPGRILNLIV
jgi:leucyl-tRNA synthetase